MNIVRSTPEEVVTTIAKRIANELDQSKKVLWLTSGGSNLKLEVDIMQMLSTHSKQLLSLAILCMDERYGKSGHADSNAAALKMAGFSPGPAKWIDILENNISFSETISYFSSVASEAFALADVIVGQFGMGADGHIAGILPNSPAANTEDAFAEGYEWEDYTRITLTPVALRQISVAFVPAFGGNKHSALSRLQKREEDIRTLPSILLYDISESYVYNEDIGDKELPR